MARVLMPLADGFEEVEASTLIDVLRRGGVDVVLAGLAGEGAIQGAHGLRFLPDLDLDGVHGPFDLVVLAGGFGNSIALRDDVRIQALLKGRMSAGQPVAAICAAPLALDAAGALTSGAFTCYPGVEGKLSVEGRQVQTVVDTGQVITSQGPATAMTFALHLLERLTGQVVRDKVAAELLYDRVAG